MGFYSYDHEGMNTQVLALVLSAIAYGLVVALAFTCFLYLLTSTHMYSRKMLMFLYLYVFAMFTLSSVAIALETRFTTQAVIELRLPDLGLAGTLTALGTPIVLPFSIWGADGFMVWRCWILYQGVRSVLRIGLICLLAFLCGASLASGILLFVFVEHHSGLEISIGRLTGMVNAGIHDTAMLLVACTAVVNFVLALLIVLRLVYHQRYMAKALGDAHGAPYPKIINICVESCALIFVTSIAGVGTVATPGSNKYLIPLLLLPHVCVLSPLLIVYRVAQGRDSITPEPSNNNLAVDVENNAPIRLEPIRFQKPLSIFEFESFHGDDNSILPRAAAGSSDNDMKQDEHPTTTSFLPRMKPLPPEPV